MSTEERGRFLTNLAADVDRLERLVRRLLDLARADVMKPDERICDAAEVIDRLAARGRAEGLDVVVEPMNARYPVAIAAEELEVAIGSLLDNARQHAGRNPTVAIELRRGQNGLAEILVADDGAGIPPAARERVFVPFFTTARAAGGTGLGLTILRSVLKAHGGSVELLPSESGARFRVRLPLS
jgi:signal transduction histidine kinase